MMANEQIDTKVTVPGYLRLSKIAVWALYFWVLLGIVSLTLRVFLLAFSANMSVGFSQFVANVSADYLAPFRGIFPSKAVGTTGYLDVSALFAIVVYIFIAWAISALVHYIQGKIDTNIKEQERAIEQKRYQARLVATKKQQTSKKAI
jgi:uncharacterized protein YggT (Ycf19 family)